MIVRLPDGTSIAAPNAEGALIELRRYRGEHYNESHTLKQWARGVLRGYGQSLPRSATPEGALAAFRDAGIVLHGAGTQANLAGIGEGPVTTATRRHDTPPLNLAAWAVEGDHRTVQLTDGRPVLLWQFTKGWAIQTGVGTRWAPRFIGPNGNPFSDDTPFDEAAPHNTAQAAILAVRRYLQSESA
jgi:hypothetical protein